MTRELRLVLGLVLLVIVGLTASGWRTAPEPSATAPEVAAEPEIPVVIVAYYPLTESHQYIVDYLREVESAHPGQVSVEAVDMQSPEGRERWQETGLSCAGVFVNGATRHHITVDGETRTVDFLKRMDVFWTREDFEVVVNDLLGETGQANEATAEDPESGE